MENTIENRFLNVAEVSQILGVSKSKAYKVIKCLNDDLKKQGLITISGKISRRYFIEKVAL
jgi:predicted transcriptional regulator